MRAPETMPPDGGADRRAVAISVLGHVRATRDGVEVDLGPPKHRALLAALAMAEGQPLDAEALAPLVWPPGQAPANPVSGLHVYISGLRRVLEGLRGPGDRPQVLVTSGGGYALEREHVAIDAAEVVHVAARARRVLHDAQAQVVPRLAVPSEVLESLLAEIDAALGRWRGEPYLDVVSTTTVAAARARLDATRLSLLEDRAVAQLSLGRHAEAVSQLGALLVERVLDERIWALYAVALVRSDRQADALEALRTARHHLAEELGVDPGPALRELEVMVLQQDERLRVVPTVPTVPTATVPAPAVADPTPPPNEQPAGRATGELVGRGDEVAFLHQQLTARGTRVLQIVGEAGIGKSTLAAYTVAQARAAEHVVCLARCPEDEGTPPLWPWLDLLTALVAQLGDGDELADELRALVDEATGTDAPRTSNEDAEVARFRLFEAVEHALTTVASRRSCVLVLEDLHWADPSTARLVAHLAGAWALTPGARDLLFVLTRRPDEIAVDRPALSAALDALARHGSLRLDLRGLGSDDVTELARQRASWDVDVSTAAELHARTAGNPFLLGELLRLGEAALRAGEVPAGVTDVLQRRLATMPADTRAALVTASVVGNEFDLEVVAAAGLGDSSAAGHGVDAVLDALDPAVAAGLVLDSGGDRMSFVHALTRDAVYASISPTRQARQHARVAEALEQRRTGRASASAEVARHWLAAGPQHAGRAWRALRDAGLELTRRFALDEAAGLLDDALTAQAGDPSATAAEVVTLAQDTISALVRAGRWADFLRRVEEAAQRADALDDIELVARFAIMPAESGPWTPRPYGTSDPAAIRRLRRVLDRLPSSDSQLRCRVMLALGSELYFSPGSSRERRALVDEGLAMARRLGDPALLGRISERAALVIWRGGNAEERLALATEAVEAAVLAGDDDQLQTCLGLRMSAALEAGRIDVMLADVARAGDVLVDRPSIYHTVVLTCLLVPWLAAQGRFEEATARLEEATRIGAGSQLPWAALALGTAHVGLAAFRPDLAPGDRDLDFVISQIAPVLPSVRLLVSLRADDVAGVRAFLETSATSLRTDDFTSLFHHALAAEAAYVVGDAKLGADAYAALAGDAGHVASAGTGIPLGPVDAHLALAAAATGDLRRAARHADDASRLMQTWGLAACEAWLRSRRAQGGW